MKKITILMSIAAAVAAISMTGAFAFQLGGKNVVKNGSGARTKMFMTAYYCSLYVPQELKGKSSKEILAADAPMSVIITVDTRFLSNEKFISATRDGFKKSAAAGYGTGKQQQFLNLFKKVKIVKGDKIYMNYVPGSGLFVRYKVKETGKSLSLGTVAGLQFKKALYAIWIGPNPVQGSLKNKMLGK
ncbi:MAG: hypothetical protein GY754_07315 [bacterium]|nr:hypothetical protein [bacterium]